MSSSVKREHSVHPIHETRRAKMGVHCAQASSVKAAWQGPGGGECTPLSGDYLPWKR